jgi:farnesyl-diphosphate farnesyltransferase
VIDAPALDHLLARTSRTFALSIPLLPEPARTEVGVAYLLFRIADTFEDAVGWPRDRRLQALAELDALLVEPAAATARSRGWLAGSPPIPHDGYLELLAASPVVFSAYAELSPAARQAIREHLRSTLAGMAAFVARCDDRGNLSLAGLDDLRAYCYAVAGIVGEMLTELFLLDVPALAPVAEPLRARARAFGEGLQLVNILKDSAADGREGRTYLPAGLPRATVLALARRDLEAAAEYTLLLQGAGAPRGLVAFNALPVLLARGSLSRVEERGPGAKLSREEVAAAVAAMERALDRGEPVLAPPP